MNEWIEKSIKLANSEGYLDKLFQIYPIEVGEIRDIPEEVMLEIKKAFAIKDSLRLIKALLKLPKFPIDHPYISILRNHPYLIEKNKKAIEKIVERVLSMDVYTIFLLASRPKSPSRQLGYSFKKWLKNIGYPFLKDNEFIKSSGVFFLEGTEKDLFSFATDRLKLEKLRRRPDFILKINNIYFVGEAKFLTDYGGSQNNQFDGAIEMAELKSENVIGIAILDGIIWFESKSYMHRKIKTLEGLALSALLLKEFIEKVSQTSQRVF